MQKILQSASTNGKRAPPLRDYQAKTLQLMKDYDGQAALCNIATGLGKTRIYTEYIRWDVSENDHHVLILSHREELVRQPLEYLKDLPCGIELGPLHADGEPIISASVQSLVGRLSEYNPYSIDTIIIDEAHHSAAPTYRKIFEYFKNAVRFGFTATSVRGDGVGLAVVFKEILCEFNTLYGIEHGYLSPIDACQVNLKFDLGTVQYREDTGDYDAADIARVMPGTAAGIAEAYTKNARGQTIIFAPSIEEGKNVTALLNADVLQHVMKAVGIRYVAYFNRRYQRDGPLFRGRYNSQPVTTKGYFLRVLRYIHRNPVAAGIVQEMQDYPWSSYLDYFGSRKKVLCQVDTSYAFALHGLEWLRSYHQRPELNTRGMLEDSPLPAFTDTELRSFIRMTAGMECHEIPLYPETITTPLLRRLVEQEGAGISQLARLTGLARGDIRRRLL